MDRQRILPAMPFNNSLYPHLKAKTAASVKPRVRRADDGNDTIILRNAPVIEPGLKAERAYTSGVLYTHVQSATESSSGRLNANSNSTEWTESKPAPFIVRQKLAKQFRELTRLKGENYDGATLMGFGSERLKEVILTMNASSGNGSESSRRQKRALHSTAVTAANQLATREATFASDSRNQKLEGEPTFSIPEDGNAAESDDADD